MSAPTPALLAAKFHRPAAPRHAVPRPALVARLNDGLAAGRPLTLIAAPAGYGKTTLAAEWVAGLDRPAAWLALDEADDDPLRFCTYFVAALQRVHPAIGAELLPALLAGQLPPQAALVTTLLNDLDAAHTLNPAGLRRPAGFGDPLVCVLDDFHAIQDAAILAVLQGLLAHAATGLHLALVTREDPALPLARLRARDQLTEVRGADLRFAGAEVAAFLRDGMGLALAESDLARLAERTEGWAAGLQLAGLSMQGRPDPAAFVASLSGSHRFILGYLTDEVLARQPAEIQEFLLRTSILGQFCAELCDAVVGIGESANQQITNHNTPFAHSPFAHSQTILAALERANVFLIPLDDEGRWYRYHHLFAELLQAQLRRRSPGRVTELHRRASRWHEAQEMPAEAINHALAAGEQGRVVALLERHDWALLNAGYTHTLEGWLRALPADLAGSSPRISLDFGWMRLLRGALDQVGPLLAQAEAALDARAAAGAAALRAECLALQANLLQASGRAAEAIAAAERSLALTAATDHRLIGLASLALGGAYRQTPDFERAVAALQRASQAAQAAGDLVTDMLAVAHLTLMATQYGRLRLAAEAATEALQRLADEHAAPPPIIGAVYGALGLIHYQWNDLELAQEQLQRGIRLGTLTGHSASVIYSQCNLARLLQAEGDLTGAAQALEAAGRLLAQGAPGWVRPELIDRQVSLALAKGDLASADARLRESSVAADDPVTHHTDPIHLAWLRLLLARGDARAAGLAQRIIGSAEAGGRHGTLLHALILAARRHADEPRAAAAYLERALALAEPEGYVRAFLDEGEAIAALLGRVGCPPWLAQHLPWPLPSPQLPPFAQHRNGDQIMTTMQHFTRRRFLKAVGVTAAAMTCAGLGYAATRTPAVATPELTLQKDTAMNKRILVTYATRAGSTAEIAQAIAGTLAGRGYAVDVKPVKEKPALDGYSAVVLGSAIRMGAWLPEAVNFVKANQAVLNALPTALFTVHMLNTGDDEASRSARAANLDVVRPLLNGAETTYFEGKMDYGRLSFLDRTVAKMVKSAEADHCDWIGIRQWANAIWS